MRIPIDVDTSDANIEIFNRRLDKYRKNNQILARIDGRLYLTQKNDPHFIKIMLENTKDVRNGQIHGIR